MKRKLQDLKELLESHGVPQDVIDEATASAALFDQDNVAKKMHDIIVDTKEALRRIEDIEKVISKFGGEKVDKGTMLGRGLDSLKKAIGTIQKEAKPFARYF